MKKTKNDTKNVSARNRKTPKPISQAEALTMLESAVSYCQQSGLKIGASNGDNGTLGIFVPGAHYILTDNGTRASFRLGAAHIIGTSKGG